MARDPAEVAATEWLEEGGRLNWRARDRIWRAIVERAPSFGGPCPVCAQDEWSVTEGYLVMSVSVDPTRPQVGPFVVPHASVVCQVCGYTLFFNMLKLGLADMYPVLYGQGSEDTESAGEPAVDAG